MPPLLASVIYLSLVAYLFRREQRQRPNVTRGLWLPTVWVFISGTRFVGQWLATFGVNFGAGSYEEGSPIDAVFFGGMTLLGIRVLLRRGLQSAEFVRHNRAVAVFVIFCLAACFWSDFPFVALKRWTKLLGQMVMVTVVMTEPEPWEAVVQLVKRFAYVFVPISFLFIKYFPELGRGFDRWFGEAMDYGMTMDKNAMGYDCMLILLVLGCNWLNLWQRPPGKARRNELIFWGVFLGFTFALLARAHSSTSLVCTVLGLAFAFVLGFRRLRPERITFYLVSLAVLIFCADHFFGLTEFIITKVLGRNMSLTDRTLIWEALLHFDINPIIGTGYESFWLGERRQKMWDLFPEMEGVLNQAHNGYLQVYLDMGVLGLLVTVGMLLAAYGKARRELLVDVQAARFKLGYWLAFLFYNWTEVAIRTHAVAFFGFLIAAISFPPKTVEKTRRSTDVMVADEDAVG
jgi:O-antigen ligase